MKLKQLTVKQSLNKAYRLLRPDRAAIEKFKSNFRLLLGHINPQESEENMKGHVMDFLKNTYFNPDYHIATKGRTDFVIHTGKNASHPAGVLFEVKRPYNHEMVSLSNLNTKAMHEIILYYLRERIEHHNNDIKYLVITNIYEWFVFDAPEFERLFFKNTGLVKDYNACMAKQKVSANNELFYNEIAKPFLAALSEEIEFTWFDIRGFEKPLPDNDRDKDDLLIPLFKILSPTHLLKLPFANDSNTLDKGFYTELLYLVGLEEVKQKSKKIIRRREEGKRYYGSLLENTILQLETENCIHKVTDLQSYGDTTEEQLFSVALELCITWINRILFLKLLEAQLLKYHNGNKDYRFLNYSFIPQYDELYKLFFRVLAKKEEERIDRVRAKYKHVPYLNSSLFEITPLEEQTIRINMLDDSAEMPLLSSTVLKDGRNKPSATKLNTLQYLLGFLDAYDFASEGSEGIQEERKTLINASVLGLIFEKINGYKDGSIFTPGFITMYMCRQSIRQAIVNKFKEKYTWKADTFEDLHNYISDDRSAKTIKDYNAQINSLTICDPAVGSGHFLVSALNELIAIKSELGILADTNGKRLSGHTATVENDELLITDMERNFFSYHVATGDGHITIPNQEIQRVQETLFHEKQTIIENCLFGVDINPKSVQICRLRLWIELLKNAYYIAEGSNSKGELQTLPNIDINIKTGNSLISKFGLEDDLKPALAKSKFNIQAYKVAVQTYREATNKEQKREMENLISTIKSDFTTELSFRDKLAKSYIKEKASITNISSEINRMKLWKEKIPKKLLDDLEKASAKLDKLDKEVKDLQNNVIYRNSFEWRFEFPEVLDNEGNFIGFDILIGNPPYIRQEEFSTLKEYLKANYLVYSSIADLLIYFVEKGINILKTKGQFSFIIANKFMRAGFGKELRKWLQQYQIERILDFGDLPVFDEATTYPMILCVQKRTPDGNMLAANIKELDKDNFESYLNREGFIINQQNLREDGWSLTAEYASRLVSKITSQGKPLKDFINKKVFRGILTGLNEAFIIDAKTREKLIDEDPKSAELIKPFLIGKDIKRYTFPGLKQWLISIPKGFTIKRNLPESDSSYLSEPPPRYGNMEYNDAWTWFSDNYPAIAKHLLPYKAKAEARTDKGDFWWELRACDYYTEFYKPKIVYPNICRQPEFIWEENGFFTNQKCFIITEASKYLLAILNSSITFYLFKQILPKLRGNFYEPSYLYFKDFPIAEATEDQKVNIEFIVDNILKLKKENSKADITVLEKQIDQLVYQLYNLTPEEIQMVESSIK